MNTTNLKDEIIQLRVSHAEKLSIAKAARRCGLNISEFLRQSAARSGGFAAQREAF